MALFPFIYFTSCAGAHKIINKFPLMQHGSVPFIYLLVGHAGVNNNNNSIQFFTIYVPSQQLPGQLQTQHSVGTCNYIII
jgi:hypothetical protein